MKDVGATNLVNKTLKYNHTMITRLINDLKETWGYETEELNDIREKMEELANMSFYDGFAEASKNNGVGVYGKKSDMDDYE
jgi:hypothetical protein